MKLFQVLTTILWSFLLAVSAIDNGLTDLVTWDEYSLTINGTRQWIL